MTIAEEIHDAWLDCNDELPFDENLINRILNKHLYDLLCKADGMLSAIRHGRKIEDVELERVYYPIREICQDMSL